MIQPRPPEELRILTWNRGARRERFSSLIGISWLLLLLLLLFLTFYIVLELGRRGKYMHNECKQADMRCSRAARSVGVKEWMTGTRNTQHWSLWSVICCREVLCSMGPSCYARPTLSSVKCRQKEDRIALYVYVEICGKTIRDRMEILSLHTWWRPCNYLNILVTELKWRWEWGVFDEQVLINKPLWWK